MAPGRPQTRPLALEAAEPDLMRRPPRDTRAPLLDPPMIVRTLVVAVTLTAVALVLFAVERSRQLGPLVDPELALARWNNPSVYAGIGAVLLMQGLYITVPFMQDVFGSALIDARALAASAAAALIILPVTWVEERWRVRRLRIRGNS